MKVSNIHSREYAMGKDAVWEELIKLSSKDDPVWPFESWPRMILRPGLVVGARGGHGPIRYSVEEIVPTERIKFRFEGPEGFDGFHVLKLAGNESASTLTHEIDMKTSGWPTIQWATATRPLHDALIEDAFSKLERSLGLEPKRVKWDLWVRILRFILS